jgi:cell division protein YceG involved in septum cleavage
MLPFFMLEKNSITAVTLQHVHKSVYSIYHIYGLTHKPLCLPLNLGLSALL